MEFIFALPLVFVPVMMPYLAGRMARNFGRKFWPWFFIGIPLPLIANIILLCLPDKSEGKEDSMHAVENEKVFDHLFITENKVKNIGDKTEVSAIA